MRVLLSDTSYVYKQPGSYESVLGLAKELSLNHDVRIVAPLYETGRALPEDLTSLIDLTIQIGRAGRTAAVLRSDASSVKTYFIRNSYYFQRARVSGYVDDYERYIFFANSLVGMLTDDGFHKQEQEWMPDVILGFDWPAAFIPMCLAQSGQTTPAPFSLDDVKDFRSFAILLAKGDDVKARHVRGLLSQRTQDGLRNWLSWSFTPKDVRDPVGLINKLRNSGDQFSTYLRRRFPSFLDRLEQTGTVDPAIRIADQLNLLLTEPDLWNKSSLHQVNLSQETKNTHFDSLEMDKGNNFLTREDDPNGISVVPIMTLETKTAHFERHQMAKRNSLLLRDAYPEELSAIPMSDPTSQLTDSLTDDIITNIDHILESDQLYDQSAFAGLPFHQLGDGSATQFIKRRNRNLLSIAFPEFVRGDGTGLSRIRVVAALRTPVLHGAVPSRALILGKSTATGLIREIGESPENINCLGRILTTADKIVCVGGIWNDDTVVEKSLKSLYASFKKRRDSNDVSIIQTGLDLDAYEAMSNSSIGSNSHHGHHRNRAKSKHSLLLELGFADNTGSPLLAVVNPPNNPSSFEMLNALVACGDSVDIVILADPTSGISAELAKWTTAKFASGVRINAFHDYDERLLRSVLAGTDFFVWLSANAPAPDLLLKAVLYGAIPLLWQAPGIRSVLAPLESSDGNLDNISLPVAYLAQSYTTVEFARLVINAVGSYHNQNDWPDIVHHNLKQDVSWFTSVKSLNQALKLTVLAQKRTIQPGQPWQVSRVSQVPETATHLTALPAILHYSVHPVMAESLRLIGELFECDGLQAIVEREGLFFLNDTNELVQISPYFDRMNAPTADHVIFGNNEASEMSDWRLPAHFPESRYRPQSVMSKDADNHNVAICTGSCIRLRLAFEKIVLPDEERWIASALAAICSAMDNVVEQMQGSRRTDEDVIRAQLTQASTFIELGNRLQTLLGSSNDDTLTIYIADNDRLEVAYSTLENTPGVEFNLLAGLSLAQGSPMKISEWAATQHVIENSSIYRSFMVIPLSAGIPDEFVGVMILANPRPAAFEEFATESLLTRSQGLIARNVARIAQGKQIAQAQTEKLVDFSRRLNSLLLSETDLREALNLIAEICSAPDVSLYLSSDGEHVTLKDSTSKSRDEASPIKFGDGLIGVVANMAVAIDGPRTGSDNFSRSGTFLALPLLATGGNSLKLEPSGRTEVLGVLFLENVHDENYRPLARFSENHIQLAQLAANTIAGSLYNKKVSAGQLHKLSQNLGQLSAALAGGSEIRVLQQSIVDTIGDVLGADASSLYLFNEESGLLHIGAATGYQRPLVDHGVTYSPGDGITGYIFQQGLIARARSIEELHAHPAWQGRQNPLQGGKEPVAFLGLPLKVFDRDTKHERVIGVLKVEDIKPSMDHPESYFTEQDELLVTMMANVIATVVYNTQLSDAQLYRLSNNLRELSDAIAAGRGRQDLVEQVVTSIAKVLSAEASSLYLLDEANGELKIKAATGYQKQLVERQATYRLGEGITGFIAANDKVVNAKSLQELRQHPAHQGKQNRLQGDREPDSFLGLPLAVRDRTESNERMRVIGVLKVENIRPTPQHPAAYFTEQDVLLVTMMANIIATVVNNTQMSEAQLQRLTSNLSELSNVLTGGQETRELVTQVVKTIASVLDAEASSLYLVDRATGELAITAASGYPESLVARGLRYDKGEGVTGFIAATGREVKADTFEELHKHPSWQGKQSKHGVLKQPNSFFGLPLKVLDRTTHTETVIGVIKVEDIKKSAQHPEGYFTEQDILVIRMMANVITTALYNAQVQQAQLTNIAAALGTFSDPRADAARTLLTHFAGENDPAMLEALALSLVQAIGDDTDRAYKEAIRLQNAAANPRLFHVVAEYAQFPVIGRCFDLFHKALLNERLDKERIEGVFSISHIWACLEGYRGPAEGMVPLVQSFTEMICEHAKARIVHTAFQDNWVAMLLDTEEAFFNTFLPQRLTFMFHVNSSPDSLDLRVLRSFLTNKFEAAPCIVFPIWGDNVSQDKTRNILRTELQQNYYKDIIMLDNHNFQEIIGARRSDYAMQHEIVAQADLSKISPYIDKGRTRLFVGRERELGEILDGIQRSSYAVIGARRTGKTSVLWQLHEHRLPDAGFLSLYLVCAVTDAMDFLNDTVPQTNTTWKPGPPDVPIRLADILSGRPLTGRYADRPLVILLDEADRLVATDQKEDWRTFSQMRALAQSGGAQIVLSGSHDLNASLRDASGPLFNMVNAVLLRPLEIDAVRPLVTAPMRQLEIELENEEAVVNYIFDVTAGQPSVVQMICAKLVELVNARIKAKRNDLVKQGLSFTGESIVRRVNIVDVEAIVTDSRFVQREYLEAYLERASGLERVIAVLMIKDSAARDFQAIDDALRTLLTDSPPDATDINTALSNLIELRSILVMDQQRFEFASKTFPKLINMHTDVASLLKIEVSGYRKKQFKGEEID